MRPEHDPAAPLAMPIKAKPYQHQIEAFRFVCERFGLTAERSGQAEGSQGQLQPVRQAILEERNQDP